MNMAKASIKTSPKLQGGAVEKRTASILIDYCWGLIIGESKRQKKAK
jgi:hypothetical protein